MTYFLNLRTNSVGGEVSDHVTVLQVDDPNAPVKQIPSQNDRLAGSLADDAMGRNVVLVTHGFNVSQGDGIRCLANWKTLLPLDDSWLFIGVLWPGDSSWLGPLCYPGEGQHAMKSGDLLAQFIDQWLDGAASISFVSHSLGARMVLQTISQMTRDVRQVALMAGAINDDCLVKEYADAAAKVSLIHALASVEDEVLSKAFPLGNLAEGIIDARHPWFEGALGDKGPRRPGPGNLRAPWQIPKEWKFGHGNYLEMDAAQDVAGFPQDIPVPPQSTAPPAPLEGQWRAAWAAEVVANRLRQGLLT
jgi:hypothetical protein